jgi:phage tail tape-measure protein
MSGLKGAMTGLHSSLIGLAGIAGTGLLVKGLVDTNAEFQTLKSSLKTVTGSTEAAASAFKLIEDFAVTTPFDLQQVTGAFIKLKALGLDPSAAALKSYGNTASAMGKSLDQMIEAVADASTGEFERLKEFGIRASKQGDEVSFTFQGITKTIGLNAAEIQGYLRSIGDVNFGGAMQDQMKNLTPAISNFNAAIDGLFVKIGEAGFNEAFAAITTDITDFITSLDPQAIEDFTRDALGAFASLLEGVEFITDSIARTMQIFEGALPGAGQLPGGAGDYRLGDFNAGQQGTNPDFARWAAEIQGNALDAQRGTFQGDDETKGILREISERIRAQNIEAVAG